MTPDTNTGKPRKERDRPFPWTCGNCLKDEVYPETMPYAIDVKHDGQLYHLEIPEIRIPKCQACGELIFSNSEDDQILQALRARVRLLTPEQIRGGRQALGLKSKEIAEKLGVAPETMSRWENGGLIQSRAMDNFLRVYFAVPEVREVLRGAEQDPSLGTMAVPVNETLGRHQNKGETEVSDRTPIIDWNRYLERIELLQQRQGSGSYQNLTSKQKQLYDALERMRDREVSKREIEERFGTDRQTWPTDFCYNLVNLEDNENKFLYQCGRGKFRFVGFNWSSQTRVTVTWTLRPRRHHVEKNMVTQDIEFSPFEVGVYEKKAFQWNFEKLKQAVMKLLNPPIRKTMGV